jgi:hypothetical protein
LVYAHFPKDHRTRICSTNIPARLFPEIRQRTNVVGVFPDDPWGVRFLGTQVVEIAEDWELERRFSIQESMQRFTHPEQALVAESMPLRLFDDASVHLGSLMLRHSPDVHLEGHANDPVGQYSEYRIKYLPHSTTPSETCQSTRSLCHLNFKSELFSPER